ncbi:hypothetical protein J4477_01550 [Candidatus Pacearchaeota archaeon]|nr:hypothetical protein [Candidatus Pacearchaeota archaeon]
MSEEMNQNEQDWEEQARLEGIATDRAFGPNDETFLVEPFCADVAWMGKQCPMYPFGAESSDKICKFLTQPGYGNYRCPAVKDVTAIYRPIFERGTPEQKKALETLADRTVHYVQNPVGENIVSWLEITQYSCLGDAITIFKSLGLAEKAEHAEEVWKELTTKPLKERRK